MGNISASLLNIDIYFSLSFPHRYMRKLIKHSKGLFKPPISLGICFGTKFRILMFSALAFDNTFMNPAQQGNFYTNRSINILQSMSGHRRKLANTALSFKYKEMINA